MEEKWSVTMVTPISQLLTERLVLDSFLFLILAHSSAFTEVAFATVKYWMIVDDLDVQVVIFSGTNRSCLTIGFPKHFLTAVT